jgi:hypothetical protein
LLNELDKVFVVIALKKQELDTAAGKFGMHSDKLNLHFRIRVVDECR